MKKSDDSVFIPGRGPIAEVDVSSLTSHGDALPFTYTDSFGMDAEGFVLRYRDVLVAFENRCPHWSVPIDQEEGKFLDHAGQFIVCPMHGAMFEADTGYCFQGPCMGDGLEKFDVIDLGGDRVEIRNTRPKLKLI